MPFTPLDTSHESGLKPAVFLTLEEQQWGEDKSSHDAELQKEIDRTKSPQIKQVLLAEQQKRAIQATEVSKPKGGFTPLAEQDKEKGFWAALTEGGPSAMLKETLPAMLATRWDDVRSAKAKFDSANEWDKERQRRIKAGESLNGMDRWRMNRLNDLIRASKPAGYVEPSPSEIWEGVKKAVVDDPGGFVGKIARGFITNPELLAVPEALPERMAITFGTMGRVATEAVQVAATVAAESALRQLNERGEVAPAQTGMDVALAAAPIVGVRAMIPRAKAQVSMAADLALAKEAKAKGIEQSGELTRTVVQDVEARIAQGAQLGEALHDALTSVEVSEDAAKEAAAMVKPEDVVPKEEKVTAAPQKFSETPIGKVVTKVQQEEKTLSEQPKIIRPQQFQPLTGVAKEPVPIDNARAILESAGMEAEDIAKALGGKDVVPIGTLRQTLSKFMGGQKYGDRILHEAVLNKLAQAGQIDPTLLKALGITGAVGIGVGAYTQDPKKAIVSALATGGVIAAGAVLRRGATAAANVMRDKRVRITNLTDDYQAQIASGQLANSRFAEQVRAMVGDRKAREAITFHLQGDESIRLTPEQKQVADAVREYFRGKGELGQKAGVIDGLLDDYVTQLWTGLDKNKSLWRNLVQSLGKANTASGGMSPRTRFNMERVIPSYKEGMAKGLIPTTTDIADIVRIYGDSVDRAIANKNFIAALKNEKMPNGVPIMGNFEQVSKAIAEVQKLTREQWEGKRVPIDATQDALGTQGKDVLLDDIRRFAESKARSDYETMTHRQLPGMMVHKDVAPVLKWFFDANDPNAATKLFYGVSIAAKRGIFSFSFFHNASLAQAMLGTSARGWLNVANGNAWELLKRGQKGDILDELVRGGLKITERPLEGDVTPFSNALKLIYERHPVIGAPAKGLHMVQKAMDAFLWSVVQPTFKTATAMAAMEKTLKRKPELSRPEAAKVAASYTNDIFGGLDWFRIADGVQNKLGRDLALAVTSPSGRRFMQIMVLAPDWTVATARTMAKAIPGVSKREIAALHQGYVVRSALLYATVADGLNMAFSGHHFWENQDPTMVDLGDGRKLQLSKHFMEPIHWLINPSQQAMNKLGYVPKEIMDQVTNKQYQSTKGAPPIVKKDAGFAAGTAARAEHAVGGFAPITGQMAYEQGVVPALSGFFGFPVYGKTYERQEIEAAARARTLGRDEEAARERVRKRVQRAKEQRASP